MKQLQSNDESKVFFFILYMSIVAKSRKYSTNRILSPKKISTKNAGFTTFPNSRQNSVNAFEITKNYKVFISHIPIILIIDCIVPRRQCFFWVSSTSVIVTAAQVLAVPMLVGPVLAAPVLEAPVLVVPVLEAMLYSW